MVSSFQADLAKEKGRLRQFSVRIVPLWLLVALWSFDKCVAASRCDEVIVHDDRELKDALGHLRDGMILKIASGDYRGGLTVRKVNNLTIEGLRPEKPPCFKGGQVAWHFSGCSGLQVRHLRMVEQTQNGLNIDDAGASDRKTINIALEKLEIEDIGPKGNCDGIKASGVQGLTIRDCRLRGWGGQGIDLVGCHTVSISHCQLEGKDGFTPSAGIQAKGGSSDVRIEHCYLRDAGERPLNIGGSTGLEFFRPKNAKHEAKQVVATKNTIEGGLCAVAFVGVDGATFAENTILYPTKWIFRILQETTNEDFIPCRNGQIRGNKIVFRRNQIQIECNVGSGTEAVSFRFQGNHWFAEDRPAQSQPKLPTEEIDGRYGTDPR